VAEPLILEPLFFKFTPLANSQPHLAERIENVVKRAGLEIPQSRMFVMNASSKLKAVNAYASGLVATKRVVVWDTSIQRMTEDEILSSSATKWATTFWPRAQWHSVFSAASSCLSFSRLSHLHWMLARWGETWAIRARTTASLPALILRWTVQVSPQRASIQWRMLISEKKKEQEDAAEKTECHCARGPKRSGPFRGRRRNRISSFRHALDGCVPNDHALVATRPDA